jgi:hypothetical protein
VLFGRCRAKRKPLCRLFKENRGSTMNDRCFAKVEKIELNWRNPVYLECELNKGHSGNHRIFVNSKDKDFPETEYINEVRD